MVDPEVCCETGRKAARLASRFVMKQIEATAGNVQDLGG